MKQFYAYVHARPDGSVFYVGKGHGRRAHTLSRRGQFHQRIIDKLGVDNVLIGKIECSSEVAAFDLERGLIKCFRRIGVTLANNTEGGEGTAGYRHTDAAKQKCREAATGERNPFYGKKRPEHAAKLKGRKRPDQSERMRTYLSEHGPFKPMLGKKHKSTTIAKFKSRAIEVANRMCDLHTGVPKSEEQRAKMSASAMGHVWLHKDGKKTHCNSDKAALLIADGWKKGQK